MTTDTQKSGRTDAAGPSGPVRGSARAAAKAIRRQQLIDATIRSIARHGLSGTTLAKVSEIAGTSIGLANFHFESKERLLIATLQHLADEEREIWRDKTLDPALTPAQRLVAIVDSRFHPRICQHRKLAIWFAFYGDAGARDIYRRVLADMDEERLAATIEILTALHTASSVGGFDARKTALALEAFYDGLWLNMLLYPDEFKRADCRDKAIGYIATLFPNTLPNPAAPRTAEGRSLPAEDKTDAP
jgi:TetR/AcrR family transcriptional repressor of bet genes